MHVSDLRGCARHLGLPTQDVSAANGGSEHVDTKVHVKSLGAAVTFERGNAFDDEFPLQAVDEPDVGALPFRRFP